MQTATQDTIDAHGNYANEGDFYRAGETLDALVPRMLAHLKAIFPDYDFAPNRNVFAGGRSVHIHVISGPAGLGDDTARSEFLARVVAEMKRFEKSNGNVLSDYHNCSFFAFAKVDERYYVQHSAAPAGDKVEKKMSLAEFKRTVKAGDRIVLEETTNEYSKRVLGLEREITQVRSGDFIIGEGKTKSHFDFPKSAAFACDGERICISDANENRPDAYRLYRWIRA